VSADGRRTVDDYPDACDGTFGISVPTVEHILDVGVVEPVRGGPPRCVTSVAIERDGDERTLILSGRGGQLTLDDERSGDGERFPLHRLPSPSPRGTGVTAWRRTSDGAIEQLLIRQVVPSDAAWLSVYGLEGLFGLEMLEEIVARRATARPTQERLQLLALPRTAPHALEYRIGSRDDHRTWFRSNGRWSEPAMVYRFGLPPRFRSVFDAVRSRPWATAIAPNVIHLQATTCPRQGVQSWALADAMRLVDREVRDHDELLGLLLGSPADAVIDAPTLGPDLARVVNGVGKYAQDYLEYTREAREEWLSDGGSEEDVADEPEIVELARLSDPAFSRTASGLASMLNDFERHFSDPEPAEWGD